MAQVHDLSELIPCADFSFFYEQRMQNDANGNPIFIGYAQEPNLGIDVEKWFIVQVEYDANQSPTRYQLPDEGVGFKYAWSNRANLFS